MRRQTPVTTQNVDKQHVRSLLLKWNTFGTPESRQGFHEVYELTRKVELRPYLVELDCAEKVSAYYLQETQTAEKLNAVVVLECLARIRSNAVDMYRRFGVTTVAIDAARNGPSQEIKLRALDLFAHLAIIPGNQANMANQLPILQALIECGSATMTKEIRTQSMLVFQRLSCNSDNEFTLAHNAAIMQVVIDCVKQQEGNDMRSHALSFLANVATCADNRRAMAENPHVMQAGIDAAQRNTNEKDQDLGWRILYNLAINEGNKQLMIHNEHSVNTAIEALYGNSDLCKLHAFGFLASLSEHSDVSIVLANYPHLVEIATEGATMDGTIGGVALDLLHGLSRYDDNKVLMACCTELLSVASKRYTHGATERTQIIAAQLLLNIIQHPSCGDLVACCEEVVHAATYGAAHGKSDEIIQAGLRLLAALTEQRILYPSPRTLDNIVSAAMDGLTKTTGPAVKTMSLRVLDILDNKKVDLLAKPACNVLIPTLIKGMDKEITRFFAPMAMVLLLGLVTWPSNTHAMANNPALIQAVLNAISKGKTEDLRENALSFMWYLSRDKDIAVNLIEHTQIVRIALSKLHTTHCSRVLSLLTSLSCFPKAAHVMDTPDLIEKIAEFFKSPNEEARFAATTLLSNCLCMSHTRSQILRNNPSEIGEVVIKFSNNNRSKDGVLPQEVESIRAYLSVFRALSILDVNRVWLYKFSLVLLLHMVLVTSIRCDDPVAILCAVDTVGHYVFDAQAHKKEQVQEDYILDAVEMIADTGNMKWSEAKRAAQYVLAKMRSELNHPFVGNRVLGGWSGGGMAAINVRLSYSLDNDELANHMTEYLQEQGVCVWRDVPGRLQNAVACMMDGMNNAELILVIISSFYVMSPSCRIEFEYACNLNRHMCYVMVGNPDTFDFDVSWLGVYIKSTPTHIVGRRGMFKKEMGTVLKDIVSKCRAG